MDEVNWKNNNSLKEKIRHGLTNTEVNKLLEILRETDKKFPKDVKCTSKEVVAKPMGDGPYVHYGLKDALTVFFFFRKNNYEEDIIYLDFNIDGFPL